MNQDVKQQWIEALRGGEYKQGRGVLRSKEDEYCCLGVLCDLMGVRWQDRGGSCLMADGYTMSLPNYARMKSGVNDKDEGVLQRLNDRERKTFPEIANYIEENL